MHTRRLWHSIFLYVTYPARERSYICINVYPSSSPRTFCLSLSLSHFHTVLSSFSLYFIFDNYILLNLMSSPLIVSLPPFWGTWSVSVSCFCSCSLLTYPDVLDKRFTRNSSLDLYTYSISSLCYTLL